ncbi:MAG: T9SS type A sorting domain-containing protein [Candidatus Eisenbacteria sp.]|nr:T9SS type A sorting domain-containing protein [Candidatus Eisenbacteria bacterium]
MERVLDWLFGTTDVAESESLIRPAWLAQNTPNPFNPDTEIRFSVPARGHVRLNVYNVRGQTVRMLANGVRETGEHAVHWDGLDNAGHSVASGVYFCTLETGGFVATRKMVLLR